MTTDLRPATGPEYDSEQAAWMVTAYDQVVSVLTDQAHFSAVNSIGIAPFEDMNPEVRTILEQGSPRFPGIIEMDPPVHTSYRGLVNAGFTPRRIAALEPMMREIAEDLVDGLEGTGADFVPAFSDPLPIRVIGEILGVPRADTDRVQYLSDAFRTLEGGTIERLPLSEQLETAQRFVAFQEYVRGMIEERRGRDGTDLVSTLMQTSLAGERPLTDEELISTVIHLLFAGQETTTRLIASLVFLLLSDPPQWDALRQTPDLSGTAIEEALRLEPPVTYHLRKVKEPVVLGDAELARDDTVHLIFRAANRDAAMFADPDAFRLDRANASRHLGLGRGIHFCVGAPIGRLEAKVALEVLQRRVPSLRLDPDRPPTRESHVMLSGMATLPVQWDGVQHRGG